jgi:hypothetical protein
VHRFKKRGGASKSRESFDFAAFALWQKDAEHRFFSVRNTYLFASSRMWSAFPAVLLIGFCNSCTDSRNVEELRNFFHVSRLIFAAFALWQKDAEHRFFSVRNTYLFSSSRM